MEQRESFLSPTPTLKQILDALKKQVLVGRAYLDTARGLLNADPLLLQTAPTFFGMAIDGSLELAQMAVARLYDTTRNTMSVPKMLKRAEQEGGTFQRGNGQEVRKAIAECQKIVVGLEPVIASIGARRNGWLAHLDPNTIADPNALAARANLTLPDLDRGFKDTEEIVLRMPSLCDGTIGELKYIGGDDYEPTGYAAPNAHSFKSTRTSLSRSGMALTKGLLPSGLGAAVVPHAKTLLASCPPRPSW